MASKTPADRVSGLVGPKAFIPSLLLGSETFQMTQRSKLDSFVYGPDGL